MLTRGLSDKVGCNNLLVILYNTFHRKCSPLFCDFSRLAGEYIRQDELKCLKLSFVNNSVQENSKRYYILSCKCRGAKQKQYVPKKPYISSISFTRLIQTDACISQLIWYPYHSFVRALELYEGYMYKKITSHKYCMTFVLQS